MSVRVSEDVVLGKTKKSLARPCFVDSREEKDKRWMEITMRGEPKDRARYLVHVTRPQPTNAQTASTSQPDQPLTGHTHDVPWLHLTSPLLAFIFVIHVQMSPSFFFPI